MAKVLGVKGVPTTPKEVVQTTKTGQKNLMKFLKIGLVVAGAGAVLSVAGSRVPDEVGGFNVAPIKRGMSSAIQGAISGDPTITALKTFQGATEVVNGYVFPLLQEKTGAIGTEITENWGINI